VESYLSEKLKKLFLILNCLKKILTRNKMDNIEFFLFSLAIIYFYLACKFNNNIYLFAQRVTSLRIRTTQLA